MTLLSVGDILGIQTRIYVVTSLRDEPGEVMILNLATGSVGHVQLNPVWFDWIIRSERPGEVEVLFP